LKVKTSGKQLRSAAWYDDQPQATSAWRRARLCVLSNGIGRLNCPLQPSLHFSRYLENKVKTRKAENGTRRRGMVSRGVLHTSDYLRMIGVAEIPPSTSPFDPGYDPVTLESHLEQSSHLMSILKISMACWMVAKEWTTRRKIASAKRYRVPTTTGGGPFEIAVAQGQLPAYLDLCADIGVTRIECGEGFTDMPLAPREVARMANQRGLEVQFELGKKHTGAFNEDTVGQLIEQGQRWLDAGARQLVVEGRESARGVGLFNDAGDFNPGFADRFAEAFGLNTVMFEAPNKPSQFALLNHFGREVHLCNVRLEEVLRVEIYRRGLHSDAFAQEKLRPCLATKSNVRSR
jgi:phosphosulfolactate synthase